MSLNVALISDDPGWHGAQLSDAFAARGCNVSIVSLRDCAIDLHDSPYGLRIPGFNQSLPDGVFVRGVPGGTLEQIVHSLDVLHALRVQGVPVYNDGRAIEHTVDKAMTSMLLQYAGISVPPTWVITDPEQAREVWMRERNAGNRLVVKPLFGSQGQGLVRLCRHDDLPRIDDCQGVYYLQRFIEGSQFDWRVFVINGQTVAGMLRRGKHWINNVAQGASCAAVNNEPELASLAESAARVMEVDYAGIDIMRNTDGVLQVIEVNGVPAWKALQGASNINIAECLVDDFYSRYLQRKNVRAVGP